MATPYTDENLLVLDYFQTDNLPTGTVPGEGWKLYVGDPTGLMVFLGTIAQLRAALAPNDLFDTQAPTSATPGREGQKAYVSHDGVVDLWQYEMGLWAKKLAGQVLNSSAGPALPKPARATFTNFQDTQAGGSVLLVPAAGLSPSDYKFRVTATGDYQDAPPDGLISVGNITGAVYAYSVATAARQQSDVAVSGTFTQYTAPTPGVTTPPAPTFTGFDDTANVVQLVPASGVPMSAYQVRIGTSGAYAQAPVDGIISVGSSFAGQVFAYSVADTGRNPSLTAASQAFTAAVVPTAPGAPVIGASTPGNATVRVTWAAPSSNGGSALTGYEVYLADSLTLVGTTAASVLFYDDNTAANGSPRSYQVLAVNAVGRGDKSASSTPVTPTAPVVVTYDTQLIIPTGNTINGEGVGFSGDVGAKLEFNKLTRTGALPIHLDLLIAGQVVASVDFESTYSNVKFRYTAPDGTVYGGDTNTFQDNPAGLTLSI